MGLHHGKKQNFFLKENPAVNGGILHDYAWVAAETVGHSQAQRFAAH